MLPVRQSECGGRPFYSLDTQGNRLAINERPVADGVVRLGCVLPAKEAIRSH